MGDEVDKAAMASLLGVHGLATTTAHQIAVPDARALVELVPEGMRLVARTSRPGSSERNLPRLVDATAAEIVRWSSGLDPSLVLLIGPYGHLVASAEVAVTPMGALVEAVYGVWELDNRQRPGAAVGRRSGDEIAWLRANLATAAARRRFSFDAGVASEGPLPSWVLRAFCDWAAEQASALEALAAALGQPQIVKVLLYAEWGMQAMNARPIGHGFEIGDLPGPPPGLPVVVHTDQAIDPASAVVLTVAVAREDAAALDDLIERMAEAGVAVAYVQSGLLSHIAIALREAGIEVRRA